MGEGERIRDLWSGPFGDEYADRNAKAGAGREAFWRDILARCRPESILELGCGGGANLAALSELAPHARIVGVDVNERALGRARARCPQRVELYRAPAHEPPLPRLSFDLVFTAGVLIHQPPEHLPLVMSAAVERSKAHVLAIEYAASEPTTVPYRGQERALFKRDFGEAYLQTFPRRLWLRDSGYLPPPAWDDCTWWLLGRVEENP